MMQFKNVKKLKLQGCVGYVNLKKSPERVTARILLYADSIDAGQEQIRCRGISPHYVIAVQEDNGISRQDIESIAKGDAVRIVGKPRTYQITNDIGEKRAALEIIARKFEKIKN